MDVIKPRRVLPIGDRPVNRQSGYETQRQPVEKPLGFHIRGSATARILDGLAAGKDVGWDPGGTVDRGDRWGTVLK